MTAREPSEDEHASESSARLDAHARTILDSVTDAFFSLDRAFRFTYLNGTAERLLLREDLVGKNIWEEFPDARGTEFERSYLRAMSERVRADFVEYYPAPLDRWYEVRAYPAPDGIAVYFQDITDRRREEERYRRGREQLELVVSSANVGVWYCDLPFDVLVWDAKVKEHFHLAPDAHVTIERFYELLHEEDRARVRAEIDRSVTEHSTYDIDYRTVHPETGAIKWVRAVGRAYYAADGSPRRFDGVTIDVSERKAIELAVRENEERYRLATRATNDVVWDWDFTTDAVRWNESLEATFGYGVGELTAPSFWKDRIHPEDRERVVTSIQRVIDGVIDDHWSAEYRFAHADGAYVDVLDRAYVVRDAAKRATRMIGAMQDLTARKRAERDRERMMQAERAARAEAERQNRMKDEFLATLSHELRTPLNAILGWAQILVARDRAAGESVRGHEIIERSARAQARIVDELLDMSALVSGKVRLELVPADVRALVETAVDTARPTADAKAVVLTSAAGDRSEPMVAQVDAARVQQILWNLLDNAIKFTPAGGEVSVRVERTDGMIAITIADTGEGIAPEFLPFVFERFRQADASSTRRHGGLGLGLSIVQQLVDLHGGAVEVTSAGAGRGTTFVVRLPAAARAPVR